MEFKIIGILFFLTSIFVIYKSIKKSQSKDKRFKKGYKNKSSFSLFFSLIIIIVLFYISYKLITF
jgi:heme/copper-type cytochrome/quinol oxidase subunit 2